MTKKDYELIATAIKRTHANGDLDGLSMLAYNMADAFKATGQKFDYDKFLASCGVDPKTGTVMTDQDWEDYRLEMEVRDKSLQQLAED